MSTVTQADLPSRLALVIQTLCQVIAARAGRERAVAPIVLLTWRYLNRVATRFRSLVRRLQAGKLATPSPRPRPISPTPQPRPPQLPRGFAWLIRLAPEAAAMGSQLQALLADPEFATLLAATPQAGKLLRPLCRMLGIAPSPDVPAALFIKIARPSPTPSAPKASPETPPVWHTPRTQVSAKTSPRPAAPVTPAPA